MIIARILGTVVSTQKDERLQGKKLLIVKPINLDGTDVLLSPFGTFGLTLTGRGFVTIRYLGDGLFGVDAIGE